jgi:hypothetical protein
MAFTKYTDKNIANFWKNVAKSTETNGCWLWTGSTNKHGYGQIRWNGTVLRAHRMSYEIHNGRKIGAGLLIAHKPVVCHNRACVNPEHLREATRSENDLDKHLDGTMTQAKLNAEQVLEIRASNKSRKDLVLEYGISQTHISAILTRRSWAHLPEATSSNTISNI